jgi:Spy/CpxP family protein refolding chaperone
MEKIAITTVIILAAMVLTSLTFASDWGRGHGRGPGDEGDITAIPELELTNEQIIQIRVLREAHLKDIRPLQDKMQTRRKELRLFWLQKTPEQDKIGAAQAEIIVLRDQMQDKMASYRQAMFRILTPEQQNRLESAIQQRKFNPGPRWGKKRQDSQGAAIRGY